MNYEDRDKLGIDSASKHGGARPDPRRGPGPEMMGADTLIGNDVYDEKDESLGDIKEIMLDVARDRLEDAPGFDEDPWPDMEDQSWAKRIHSYYGTEPYAEELRA